MRRERAATLNSRGSQSPLLAMGTTKKSVATARTMSAARSAQGGTANGAPYARVSASRSGSAASVSEAACDSSPLCDVDGSACEVWADGGSAFEALMVEGP